MTFQLLRLNIRIYGFLSKVRFYVFSIVFRVTFFNVLGARHGFFILLDVCDFLS